MTFSSGLTAAVVVVTAFTLLLLANGGVVRTVEATTCAFTSLDTYPKGKCVSYSGFCHFAVGSKVFVPDDPTYPGIDLMDAKARSVIDRIRSNSAVVSEACITYTDLYACTSNIFGCTEDPATGEGIPILPCQSICSTYWSSSACQGTAQLYYQFILLPQGQTAVDSEFPFCDPNGYFTAEPLPPDRFGGREIPGRLPYPAGLKGLLLYPPSTYTYTLSTGVNVTATCANPPRPSTKLTLPSPCKYPMVDVGGGSCQIPCPFPLYSDSDVAASIVAFVVPGVVALLLCLFVLVDALWVMFESTGGDVWAFIHKFTGVLYFAKTNHSHEGSDSKDVVGGPRSPPHSPTAVLSAQSPPTVVGSSFAGVGASARGMGGGAAAGGGGGRHRMKRTQLRAATFYALLGAILGIIYFFIGPFITLVEGKNVSCRGTNTFTDLSATLNVSSPSRDPSSSSCKAQRAMPFILQAIFNLILYAMVRVYLVVTNTKFELESRRRAFDSVLSLYCAGVPLLCLIISFVIEGFGTSLDVALVQLTRQTTICIPRYNNVGVEFALIFLPFVLTGLLIILLCAYVYRYLRVVQRQVESIKESTSKSSIALQHLLIRLAVLGMCTFNVLIVLMSTTGTIMETLASYSHDFQLWFVCNQAAVDCKSCDSILSTADSERPPTAVFSLQLFCMSMIACLFGGFFGAQSASRLLREYRDGSLQKKLDNVWYGRHIMDDSATDTDGVGHRNDSAEAISPSTRKLGPNKDANSLRSSQVGTQLVAAAYMSETPTPTHYSQMEEDVSPIVLAEKGGA